MGVPFRGHGEDMRYRADKRNTSRDRTRRIGSPMPAPDVSTTAVKPILEVNLLTVSLAGLGEDEKGFKDNAAHLLLHEARVLDGKRPTDVRGSPTARRACRDAGFAPWGRQPACAHRLIATSDSD
jgi:hypothetical protein